MINEQVTTQLVREPLPGRAHAPVVLLAVAAPECLGIEHADGIDGGARHHHAKTNPGRNIHVSAGVERIELRIEFA